MPKISNWTQSWPDHSSSVALISRDHCPSVHAQARSWWPSSSSPATSAGPSSSRSHTLRGQTSMLSSLNDRVMTDKNDPPCSPVAVRRETQPPSSPSSRHEVATFLERGLSSSASDEGGKKHTRTQPWTFAEEENAEQSPEWKYPLCPGPHCVRTK